MTNFIQQAMRWLCRLLLAVIIAVAIIIVGLLWSPVKVRAADAWTSRQVIVHEMADMARGIGLAEDNAIIVECSRIWWEDEITEVDDDPESVIRKDRYYLKLETIPEPWEYAYTVSQDDEQAGPNMTYLGTYYITGYDICPTCTGKTDGITASGTQATVGRTIAAGTQFEYGTHLYIEGIGERVVEDRGPTGDRIDVLCNNHSECYALTGSYQVYLMED